MADFSSQFMDDLGPLGAIWAGRNQGMQENTNLVNQQNTLEQIANSQQTRDIQQQKLPFELSKLQHEQDLQPFKLEEAKLKNRETTQKLDAQDFGNAVAQMHVVIPQLTGTPADGAVLADIVKKNNLNPDDPRLRQMMNLAQQGNAKALQEVLKAIDLADPKSVQERAKQGDIDTAHMDREKEITRRSLAVADKNNEARIEAARIRAQQVEAAKAKLANIDQEIVNISKILTNPNASEQEKTAARERGQMLTQYRQTVASAVASGNAEALSTILNGGTLGGAGSFAGSPFVPKPQEPTQPDQQPQPGAGQPVQITDAVKKAGWAYEPDKYVYRVTPDGKVQRKLKGQ